MHKMVNKDPRTRRQMKKSLKERNTDLFAGGSPKKRDWENWTAVGQKNESGPLSHIMYKNKLKMD